MTRAMFALRRGGTPDSAGVGSGPESSYSRPSMRRPTAVEQASFGSATLASSYDPDVVETDPKRSASSADRIERPKLDGSLDAPSPAFARLRMKQTLRETHNILVEFRRSLGTPESAVWMTHFRASLESLWKYVPAEDVHRARAISAIQASIRFQKWRTFNPQSVAMLSRAVELTSATEFAQKDSDRVYGVLRSGQVDLFPSAAEEAYDEEDETSD